MLGFFERLVNPFPKRTPDTSPHKLSAFLRYYLTGLWPYLMLISLLTACLSILEVSLFGFMGDLVDWLVDKNPDTFMQEEGKQLFIKGALMFAALIITVFFHAALIYQTMMGNFPMRVRWLAHRYLLRQSISFYQEEFAGRLATKVMQTSLAVRETIMKLLDIMVYIIVYFISMMVMIAAADYRLMLPLLGWLILYIGIQVYFLPRLKNIATIQADARSSMTGRIVDSYTNIQTVKLFSHTSREFDYARESMDDFLSTVYTQMRLVTWLNLCMNSINYGLVFIMAATAIGLWLEQSISIGAIAIAISLALRINGMSQWIMFEIGSIFEHIGTAIDGMNTLSKPTTVNDQDAAQALHIKQGHIQFENISFTYPSAHNLDAHSERPATEEAAKIVFDKLCLDIQAGEKIGLVGRSGAGKSTLVNLLLRFYDLDSGRILIDGQDIKQVQQESLRQHIGMVTQDTSLLHRSVRDNILYGSPNASEEELIAATTQASAHEFIQHLEDANGRRGYAAQVGERGVKLSGGQRQRIAISRVLLKDAPILILDEATSALDSEVEAAIQANLKQLMHNKTVIAIAHRLSTIAAMDRLIVLDKGRIVEQGSHQELLQQNGIYAGLWAHQSGGFLGE